MYSFSLKEQALEEFKLIIKLYFNEKLEKAQRLYESVSENVQYIVEKIDEVKEIPGTVQTLVAETKEAFSNNVETN